MSEKQLLEKITTSGLIKKNDRIVIGLSGGPDSVALTILLNKLKNKLNLSLFPVHINYHLRGKESERDESFCRKLAQKLKLPLFVYSPDKNTLKKTSRSLQDLAREIRFNFLEKTALKCRANKITLAHQSDDQAETILMKFLRGSGKEGLTGISKTRFLTKKIQLVHPLLSISRKEILLFLRNKNIKARSDKSNFKPVYLRNKIRLKLIPLLEKNYQPQIKAIMNNMAEIMESENDYLENITERTAKKFIVKNGKTLSVDAKKLLKIHPVIQARILQSYIKKFTKGYNVGFGHICSLQKILTKKRAKLDLPKKLTAEKINDNLFLFKN